MQIVTMHNVTVPAQFRSNETYPGQVVLHRADGPRLSAETGVSIFQGRVDIIGNRSPRSFGVQLARSVDLSVIDRMDVDISYVTKDSWHPPE